MRIEKKTAYDKKFSNNCITKLIALYRYFKQFMKSWNFTAFRLIICARQLSARYHNYQKNVWSWNSFVIYLINIFSIKYIFFRRTETFLQAIRKRMMYGRILHFSFDTYYLQIDINNLKFDFRVTSHCSNCVEFSDYISYFKCLLAG